MIKRIALTTVFSAGFAAGYLLTVPGNNIHTFLLIVAAGLSVGIAREAIWLWIDTDPVQVIIDFFKDLEG